MRDTLTDSNHQPFTLALTSDGYNPKDIYIGGIKICQVDIKWPVEYVADYWIHPPGNREPIFGGHNWDQCGAKIIELLTETSLRLLWPIKNEETEVTETDYILATNVARARAALDIVRSLAAGKGYGVTEEEYKMLNQTLYAIQERLSGMIETEED